MFRTTKRMYSARDKMKHKSIRAAAAIVAAALLSFPLSGCALLRPIDGSAETTDVVSGSDTQPQDTQPMDSSAGIEETTTVPTTTAAQPPETTPPVPSVPAEQKVSILAVGDNIIHEAVYVDAKNRASDGEEYNFLPMYSAVAERIQEADIAFVNQEAPMAGKDYGISGYPTFNAPRETAAALIEAGFDVINLANNHIMDKRAAGARATVEYVQSLPVTSLGVYLDQADFEHIRVTEVNGIRIAWVSFCQDSNNPHDNNTSGVIMPRMDDDNAIAERIRDAAKISDFVIASAHWGIDGKSEITSDQRRLAKVMAEAGADVILGHHPHILQSVEWLDTSSGTKSLVAYSLGNFLSAQLNAPNMIGGMLTFDIVKDSSGLCRLEAPVMEIAVNHYDGEKDLTQAYDVHRHAMQMYMLEDYTDELAARHGCRFFSSGFTVKWIEDHVRSIIAEEFLPPCLE